MACLCTVKTAQEAQLEKPYFVGVKTIRCGTNKDAQTTEI